MQNTSALRITVLTSTLDNDLKHSDEEVFGMSCKILGGTHFVVTKLPSEKFVINYIFAITFNGLLMIPTVLLNAVAIITTLKSSQLKSKPCYFIILVQSVIDLAVGVLSILLMIFFLASGIGGLTNCIAASLAFKSGILPFMLSCVTLSALTIERYIAILHPYAYRTQVTKKRLLIYIGCGAVVTISLLFLFLFNPRLYHICLAAKVVLISSGAITLSNFPNLKLAERQAVLVWVCKLGI